MSGLLQSYLFAWLFLLSVSLGAMANLMVHALVGGRWGEPVRPALTAATRLVPLVALLFLPILLGAERIYPWSTQPGRWLNLPFFAARSHPLPNTWSNSPRIRPSISLIPRNSSPTTIARRPLFRTPPATTAMPETALSRKAFAASAFTPKSPGESHRLSP